MQTQGLYWLTQDTDGSELDSANEVDANRRSSETTRPLNGAGITMNQAEVACPVRSAAVCRQLCDSRPPFQYGLDHRTVHIRDGGSTNSSRHLQRALTHVPRRRILVV
jgi:hypothetical protein